MREEKDSLGTVLVPAEAYYGAQTQRALDNFPISGQPLPRRMIQGIVLIKQCAALVNRELSLLDARIAGAISAAAREILDGELADQFPVDVFQTGSGTSTNMNVNEVIAARANEMLSGRRGGKHPVHPNDHVNLGQSSNDVIPTALHVSAMMGISGHLVPSLDRLRLALDQKAEEFKNVHKIGRTHLQDAVPITLGQEFSGYARQVALGIRRIETAAGDLLELALGGTAVGTGINTHPEFARRVIEKLCENTHIRFREAENHFEAQGARDAAAAVSGALLTLAAGLVKIANDVRWLSSGPRCGIGEIHIPALQPGSSIMPGKINPVMPEAVIQVAYQVMGNDTAVALGCQSGIFELNVAVPLIAHNLLQSVELLGSAAGVFADRCIRGITANRDVCAGNIEKSLALVTALVPEIGYDKAAEAAQKAYRTGRTVREIVREMDLLPGDRLDELLRP